MISALPIDRGWRTDRRELVLNAKYGVRDRILSLSVTDLRTTFLRAPGEFDKSLEIWSQSSGGTPRGCKPSPDVREIIK